MQNLVHFFDFYVVGKFLELMSVEDHIQPCILAPRDGYLVSEAFAAADKT